MSTSVLKTTWHTNVPKTTWIVGEAPAKNGNPARPFSGGGPTSERVISLLGVADAEDLLSRFVVRNLFPAWPGRVFGEKGDAFPMSEARRLAEEMQAEMAACRAKRAVLFSIRLAEAFRVVATPFAVSVAEWHGATVEVAVIPHPSGIVRFWNEHESVERAKDFLTHFARRGLR